jgi:heptosyltransferase I
MSPLKYFKDSPPAAVCLLRLSAIGDTCHTLAVLRTLQKAWPKTRFTWIIGSIEHQLLSLVPEVEFISYDKRGGIAEFLRLRNRLAGRRFDLLLHMQLALRASLLSTLVRAPVKLGFDRARARELQWLFTTNQIAPENHVHVLDALFGFSSALGIENHQPFWNVPLPATAEAYAQALTTPTKPTMIISACSSHRLRNWRPERYAEVADYAVRAHGMRVILCGGPGATERAMADAIQEKAHNQLIDQVGKDTLPQFLALLGAASVLLTPDSGPAHMATMVGTPVIGLYAATNPLRSGPYFSQASTVNCYPEAARMFLHKEPAALPWSTKIERLGVMDLITPARVIAALDSIMQKLSGQ